MHTVSHAIVLERKVGEAILHLLALAQLVGIVEVGHIDHAFEVVGLGKPGDDLVDFVADLFIAMQNFLHLLF